MNIEEASSNFTELNKKKSADKPLKEFKKGRMQNKPQGGNTKKDPKKTTLTRIMITFEDEPSYRFLLNDLAELQKLKENSYLDLDYLEQFKKYRVHLYYQDDLRTRIAYWETKYPEISKSIERDENIIRLNTGQNNTLSRAIEEANALKFPLPNHPEDLIHNPPTPPDEIKVNKKVKVMGPFGLPTPDTRKTRNELLSEVRNLRINLAMISTDLQKRTQENCQLRKDLEKTQKKMQTLVDQQKSFKTFFDQFINNLPTSSKSHYENMFSKFDQTCGDGSALEQEPEDLDIESPKSRDFSSLKEQLLERGSENAERSKLENVFWIDSPKSIPSSQLEFKELEFHDNMRELEVRNDELKESDSSYENKVVQFEQFPSQTGKRGETTLETKKTALLKNTLQNKSVKNVWSHLPSGVQNVIANIKEAKIPLETIEKDKNTPQSWRPVIRDYKKELIAFINQ